MKSKNSRELLGWVACLMAAITLGLPVIGMAKPKEEKPFNKIVDPPKVPVELILEGEDFQGMKVFPDWHRQPGQGWYVKEHKHASGRAFIVCDSESEGMSVVRKLDKTNPAGDYMIGVRGVLTRWTNGKQTIYATPSGNLLRVELGMLTDKGFDCVGYINLPMLWGSGYGFLPAPLKITETFNQNKYGIISPRQTYEYQDPIARARGEWNAIRLIASKVVSGGIGDTPEFALPYVLVDNLKISNIPGYKWSFDRRGRNNLLTAAELKEREREIAERAHGSSKDDKAEQADEAKTQTPTARGNLLRDGSFEAGGYPHWSPVMVGEMEFTFDAQDIVKGKSPHGEKFARLNPAQAGPHADQDDEPPALNANIRSDFFDMPPGEYTVSFTARASNPPETLGCGLINNIKPDQKCLNSFELTKDWSRYSFAFSNSEETVESVWFSFNTKNPDSRVDIDCVQVTPKSEDFAVYREGEGAGLLVACDRPWNIFYDDEPLEFEAILVNDTDSKKTLTAEYALKDAAGKTFLKGSVPVSGAKGVSRKKFALDFKGYGPYALVYNIKEQSGNPVFVQFDRIQNPTRMEKNTKRKYPYIGGMTRAVRGRNAKLLRYYGYQFKTDLSDPCIRANANTYGYREHHTYKADYKRMHDAGLTWALWFWCGQPAPYDDLQYASGPAPHGGRPWMSDKEAAWYAVFLLKTYKGLHDNLIMPSDEYLNQRVPRDGVGLLTKVYKAVKDYDPKVEIMNSVEWPVTECLNKMLGGTKGKWSDWLGGSRYGCDKWWYMREARTLDEAGIDRFWVDGVSLDHGYPRSLCLYYSRKGTPVRTAMAFYKMNQYPWDLALMTACYRPEKYCTYTCKYGQAAADPRCQFSLYDGRLTPVASQWLVMLQFLRDADRGRVLFPKQVSNLEACTFVNGKTTWIALYAPAPALLKEVTLDMPADSYVMVDNHLLESKAEDAGKGKSKFTIKRLETLFLGSSNPNIVKAVENMKVKNLMDARHVLAMTKDGKAVECRAVLRNNSGKPIAGKAVLYKDMFYGKEPVEFEFNIKPGESETFVQRQNEGVFSDPTSYYPVKSQLHIDGFFMAEQEEIPEEILQNKEGEVMRPDEYFFTHHALPLEKNNAGKLDISILDQWHETQRPAAVLINWGGGGSVKRAQVRLGAENTDCNMQPDGLIEYDYYSLHFVRYDKDALYIGALVEDQPAFSKGAADWGEKIVYTIQPEMLDRLDERSPKDIVTITVVSESPDRISAVLARPDGSTENIETVCSYDEAARARRYILKAPFKVLGFRAKPNMTFGFDITCFDSDEESGTTECELDWAGASCAPGDAFGYGSLMFR